MNKFWEWMDEKGYGAKDGLFFLTNSEGKMWLNPMPQMIIGYMMQYLDETTELNSEWNGNHFYASSTKERYNWLEDKIKSIGEGKK